jgi:hypothetical protein
MSEEKIECKDKLQQCDDCDKDTCIECEPLKCCGAKGPERNCGGHDDLCPGLPDSCDAAATVYCLRKAWAGNYLHKLKQLSTILEHGGEKNSAKDNATTINLEIPSEVAYGAIKDEIIVGFGFIRLIKRDGVVTAEHVPARSVHVSGPFDSILGKAVRERIE